MNAKPSCCRVFVTRHEIFYTNHKTNLRNYILVYFIDYAITVVPFFSPLYSPLPCTPFPPTFHPFLSSCPWVVHISSLASPFPILFLTSPVYFVPTIYASYSLYLSPILSLPLPANNPPSDLHICDFVPVLVHLVWFLDSVFDSCEFIATLTFIV